MKEYLTRHRSMITRDELYSSKSIISVSKTEICTRKNCTVYSATDEASVASSTLCGQSHATLNAG